MKGNWKPELGLSKGHQTIFLYGWTDLHFSSICDVLRDLVPFVQSWKYEKHPWRSVTFSTKDNFVLYHFLKPHWCFDNFFPYNQTFDKTYISQKSWRHLTIYLLLYSYFLSIFPLVCLRAVGKYKFWIALWKLDRRKSSTILEFSLIILEGISDSWATLFIFPYSQSSKPPLKYLLTLLVESICIVYLLLYYIYIYWFFQMKQLCSIGTVLLFFKMLY